MFLNWNWTKHVVNWLFSPFIIMATVWVIIVSLVIHVVTITIVIIIIIIIIIIVRWPCIVATLHWAGGPCMWKEVFRSFWKWVTLVSLFLRRHIKECTNLGGVCLISSPCCGNALYLVLEQWGSKQKKVVSWELKRWGVQTAKHGCWYVFKRGLHTTCDYLGVWNCFAEIR